jgi:hypothetical protein
MSSKINSKYINLDISEIVPYNLSKDEINICKFYKKEYIDVLNNILEPNIYNKIKLLPAEHWKYGSIFRYNIYKTLSLNLFIDTVNTILVLYKIKDTSITENKEVIYSIGYVNIKPKEMSLFFDNNINLPTFEPSGYDGNLYINNVCVSGSTISKDGEYRPTLIYWKYIQFILSKDKELNNLFKDMQEYFIKKLQYRKYLIYCRYNFPTDAIRNKYAFELELMASNKKIDFFIINWFLFYFSYVFETISSHLNDSYKEIMLKYKIEDNAYFKELINKYTITNIRRFYHLCNTNIRSSDDLNNRLFCKTKLGQKIIPISLREIQNPFMILYKPWKEYLIGLKLTNLVVNNITCGFPIMINWIFIKNEDEHLYDNPSQAERLKKSILSKRITDILNQANYLSKEQIINKDNYIFDIDSYLGSSVLNKQKKLISSWLSREFRILNNKVNDAIEHANEHIAMSNVSFCIFTEYVGRTLYESFFITKKSKYYSSLVSPLFTKEGFPYFQKYIFELCYNLLCLSEKCGIIHGDLHMHNLTLNSLFYKLNVNIPNNPKILYIIKKKTYVFDTNFYNLTLIDFSRAIIDPSKVNNFKEPNIHKIFDIVNDYELFEVSQNKQLFDYLISCKPEYKEIGLSLQIAMRRNFSIFFKILSSLDLYMITLRFLDFFKYKKDLNYQPYIESVNLIKKINYNIDIYLSKALEKVINHKELINEFKEDEWPIYTIIKNTFFDKKIKINDIDSIVDIYNYNNDSEYSLTNIKNLLPPLKETNSNNNFIKNSIKRKYKNDSIIQNNYKTINLIMNRQREKH